MKWIELKVLFDGTDRILAEELIANVFYDLGLKGVAIAHIDEEPADEWAEDAIKQPNQRAVTGYIPSNESASDFLNVLKERLALLDQVHHIQSHLLVNHLDEEDWAESWKEFFWPEKIGRRIVVKPTWRSYRPVSDDIVIELDPGMAFGTGTHPTSGMCIQLLEDYVKNGDAVLDVGAGSGILMVAAVKLGAALVWGVDNDAVAVKVAHENLILNKVSKTQYQVLQGDLMNGLERQFSLIVANILSEVIISLLDDIPAVLSPQGKFIFSGITEENAQKVKEKIVETGMIVLETRFQDGWCAIVGKHRIQEKL